MTTIGWCLLLTTFGPQTASNHSTPEHVFYLWFFRVSRNEKIWLRSSALRIPLCITNSRAAFDIFDHYSDVIMGAMASKITSVSLVCTTVCSGADKKHPKSASLAFVRGIQRWPVNSPHKGSVTRKMFPFNDVILTALLQELVVFWHW